MAIHFNALTDITPGFETAINQLTDTRESWCKENQEFAKNCDCTNCTTAVEKAEKELFEILAGGLGQ